jgi:hypothetical protein
MSSVVQEERGIIPTRIEIPEIGVAVLVESVGLDPNEALWDAVKTCIL